MAGGRAHTYAFSLLVYITYVRKFLLCFVMTAIVTDICALSQDDRAHTWDSPTTRGQKKRFNGQSCDNDFFSAFFHDKVLFA